MEKRIQQWAAALVQFWNSLPLAIRCLVLGTGVLGLIMAGGVITAYGGILLLFIINLLCLGLTWYLVVYAGKKAIGPQSGWKNKNFRIAYLISIGVAFALLAGLIFYRRTLYMDDYINYWSKQDLLRSSFGTNGFYGMSVLLDNLLRADYKVFSNLFVSIFYQFTDHSIQAFMICMFLGCLLPAWYAVLLVAEKIGQVLETRHPLYLPAAGLMLGLWPLLMNPITHAMPDAQGLTFLGIIFLLCWDYRFEKLEPGRLLGIFAATFCLIITRRWYMYLVVGFYAWYSLLVLAGAVRNRRFGRTLGNMAIFGGISLVGILGPLCLTFLNILSTDYGDVYGAYYGGGIWNNILHQLDFQGWLLILLTAAGLGVGLAFRAIRWPAFCLAGATLTAFVLFVQAQSLGYHQSLILVPGYLCFWFVLLAALSRVKKAAPLLMGAVVACMGYNFLVSMEVLPQTALAGSVPSDLTRRTDFEQIEQVGDWVLENCPEGETVYINIYDQNYGGNTFRFSGDTRLRDLIVWNGVIPSTAGYPLELLDASYVMVTDATQGEYLCERINQAFQEGSPVLEHFEYVCDFPLEGVTLRCYRRTTSADQTEAEYILSLMEDFDARWPELYSQRVASYLGE